jgi:hypothetical protein
MIQELQDLGMTINGRSSRPITTAHLAMTSTCYISLNNRTADWVLEAAKKLEALGRLRPGWDSYGGVPLKRGTKELTLRILDWLGTADLPVPAVVLGSGGTVQLEWRTKGKELDVELRDNNTIEFVKVYQAGNIEEGETADNLSAKVHDLSRWLLR